MMALWSAIGDESAQVAFAGVGIVLGGAGAFLLGRHLNVTGVDAKADQLLAPRAQQLDQLVTSGQFQLAPGVPMPRSMEEARQQSNQLLEEERKQVRAALRNRHTLFWIPAQWVGVIAVAGGLAMALTSLG